MATVATDPGALEAMTVRDLRDACKDLGLATTGLKKALVDRILEARADGNGSALPVASSGAGGGGGGVGGGATAPEAAAPKAPASPVTKTQASPSAAAGATAVSRPSRGGNEGLSPLFFVPNIIGYLRLAFLISFCYYAKTDPRAAGWSYFLSYLLDALDGYAARALDQSTRFGAVLDMVLDRCTSAALAIVLSALYPGLLFACLGLVLLDLASHYVRMYTSMLKGQASHKDVTAGTNTLLRWYYSNRYLMFTLILGCEGLQTFAYLAAFGDVPVSLPFVAEPVGVYSFMVLVCAPFFAYKQLTNVLQLLDGFGYLLERDIESRQKGH